MATDLSSANFQGEKAVLTQRLTDQGFGKVYEIDPLRDPRWNSLIATHPLSSVFHSRSWLQALHNAYSYEPLALSTSSPSEELKNALVFCRVKSWMTGNRLVSLPFSDHCDPLVNAQNELDHLLLSISAAVGKREWKYVEIRPAVLEPGPGTKLEKSVTYLLHRLDLRKSSEELFRSFHKDCVQRKIRRAEREQLSYDEGRSEALLQAFYRLLIMTRKRQYLPPQPLSWFRQLISAFGEAIKIRVASKNGVPVASIVTLTHRTTMTYKYGCSDARFNNLGGMAFLFWRIIQEAKECGLTELDFGRSDPANTGLVGFKEHWKAIPSVLNYWRYPHMPHAPRSAWKTNLLNKAASLAPNASLVAAGNLLYRHIG